MATTPLHRAYAPLEQGIHGTTWRNGLRAWPGHLRWQLQEIYEAEVVRS